MMMHPKIYDQFLIQSQRLKSLAFELNKDL